jgi:hypothetical protein
LTEPLDCREAFFRGRFFEVATIEAVGFFETRDPDDALNGHLHLTKATIDVASP